MRFLKIQILFLLFLIPFLSLAQETKLSIKVIDAFSQTPVEGASISENGKNIGFTDKNGSANVSVKNNKNKITVSFLGYKTKAINLEDATLNETIEIQFEKKTQEITEVTIEDKASRREGLKRLDPKLISNLPSVNNSVEALLKTLPGVSSNNELSSQYNVRGGNFDENLVYVNDIEIYRPFLVRSGQQEGLSFINPDMVSSILFSAGGFDAKYGDKMASVLDVQYRRPKEFSGSVSGSFLDAAVHLEGTNKSKRFSWITGIRQRSNQYILKSIDVQGDYKPSFTDAQLLMNYDFTPEFSIEVLGNYARNKYQMIPESRLATFGTVNKAKQLRVYFDGQEISNFETGLAAVSAIYKPNNDTKLKLIASAFQSSESETYDVSAEYFIGELETDFSKNNFGEVISENNAGGDLRHGRNYLNSRVINVSHVGVNKNLKWGVKYQNENIQDKLSEWRLIDSVGYAIPVGNPLTIDLQDVIKQDISINSNRTTGYVQNTWNWGDSTDYSLTIGARANYWDLNNQLLFSPRASFTIIPNIKPDILFRFSTGYYYQPPFYRELRGFDGQLNYNLKAQTSIHFIVAADYNFTAWNRPFKLIAETYYKYLDNIIPYEIDNVRIRYYAQNNAKGYARGVDLKVNGEFIKGVESWMSLSIMKTQEDIKNDFFYTYLNSDGDTIRNGYTTNAVAVDSIRTEPGYIPRPTDQRFTFAIFFQDYIPKFPSYKMNLTVLVGAPLPFGPPSYDRYKDTLRMRPYRRVDIGFSKVLKAEDKELKPNNPFRNFKSIILSLEVFNLLGIQNTVSYMWVKDISNNQYAIPNYLTNRRINLKLTAKF